MRPQVVVHPMVRVLGLAVLVLLGAGCSTQLPVPSDSPARLASATSGYRDLVRLPPPKGKIVAAVYGFRDQTGQYKPSPDSSFSTSVTQGAASILTKALSDSGWFTTVEREGLQNLLTERRVIRAIENPQDRGNPAIQLPPLMPASIVIEGGVIAYETNVRTGGAGVRYLGVGVSEQYRVDQVSVNVRAVDVRTGQVLSSVTTAKTIYSRQLDTGLYRFVSFRKLLEAEVGYSRNEPPQVAVREAIEAAVVHLIVQGVRGKLWDLKDEGGIGSPVFQAYLHEADELAAGGEPAAEPAATPAGPRS